MLETTTCSPLEDLAAFAEGRLRGAARDRVIAHLNDCTDCRELLAGMFQTADDLAAEETDRVVPMPPRRPLPPALRAGIAAAVAVVAVGAFVIWQIGARHTPPSPTEWLAEMPPASELAPHVWGGSRERGPARSAELAATSAEIGALLVDAEVTVRANDVSHAAETFDLMATMLDGVAPAADVETLRALAAETDAAGLRGRWEEARPRLDKDLAASLDPFHLSLGTFLEEAQIAARAGNQQFLDAPRTRRQVDWLLSQQLPDEAREALRLLASQGTPANEKADALRDALGSLAR
jgi:hypothetical protein